MAATDGDSLNPTVYRIVSPKFLEMAAALAAKALLDTLVTSAFGRLNVRPTSTVGTLRTVAVPMERPKRQAEETYAV